MFVLRSPARLGRTTPYLLAMSGWVALLALHLPPAAHPLRVVVTFGFILLCPGIAVARLLPISAGLDRWVAAVALGLSLSLLVSVGFTVARVQSPEQPMITLAALTSVAALAPQLRTLGARLRIASAMAAPANEGSPLP